ncbi:MAG TPA: permease [Acidimicrobiales bacterium]|nr:permease [Acidimicrobiales bacterium]
MPHLLALSTGGLLLDIGRSLKEAFFMFYDTLWALVLGFGLSGAVQAFVSREAMQRRLGNHRPAAVLRASLYGTVSSSCSYAASAMAKSLFKKGADFVASMVFMFASTNLVLELGIVLVVLIGWQFVAAEFVGGTIMIALLVLAGGLFFRGRALEEARRRVGAPGSAQNPHGEESGDRRPTRERLGSLAGWSDAASYTMADLTMLRREMLIGYTVAGFLAVLVPVHLWNDVFLRGHGFGTTLENVVVGPLIAVISYVCSIGNVPLAAALWKGGISFGGVVSFIFADLITMPLLLIYTKLYGARMALRMLAVFWVVMSIAGLATEGIFRTSGIVPATRPVRIAVEHFSWDYTGVLDLVFLAAFALVWYLSRHRHRFGGGAGYTIDPVCGMQVEQAQAPASIGAGDDTLYFCSDHCRERFTANPSRFPRSVTVPRRRDEEGVALVPSSRPVTDEHEPADQHEGEGDMAPAIDPVCGMTVDPATASAIRRLDGVNWFFCGAGCADAFDGDPARYAAATREHNG